MMTFIMMTLSFTVAILLATGLAFILMLNKKVMKWYTKRVFEYMNNMDAICDEIESE